MERINKVKGDGPIPCQIMLIGEAPGKNEDIKGRPFMGKSGSEMTNMYLPKCARLSRKHVYVTNLVKCRTNTMDRDPTKAEIDACSALLWAELQSVQPRYIGLVGRIATQWALGPTVRMERVHGFGYEWEGRLVMPLYHPAYGLHNTAMMRHIMEDFEHFGSLVRGSEKWVW